MKSSYSEALNRFFACCLVGVFCSTGATALAQDVEETSAPKDDPNVVSLVEDLTDTRVTSVRARVSITGTFLTAGEESALKMKVESGAAYDFQERKIVGTGQGAEAYRSVRDYTGAEANTIVDTRKTNTRLNGSLSRLIAQGKPGGIEFSSMTHHMTRADLDLLSMPGDTLPVIGLLPAGEIKKGDTWTPPLWAIQSVTGIEAMLKNDMTCKLDSFTDKFAMISFKGTVQGAVYGATSEISVSGKFHFDRAEQLVTHFELTQNEKRSVGTVSPGMDVVANVKWDRSVVKRGRITDKVAESVPLIPNATTFLLSLRTPWGTTFQHDRNWHVFHQTPEVAILRLVESGGLVAQLNVTKVIDAKSGESTSEEQFQADIREALGERLTKIEKAELIKTGDDRRIYRVVANGNAGDKKMTWLYYLCTAASGKQSAFVFSVGADQLKNLGDRHVQLVTSVAFAVGQIASSPKK